MVPAGEKTNRVPVFGIEAGQGAGQPTAFAAS